MELVLDNVTKNFGGLRAVGDVSFTVRDNVIFGLIGPNGAGKTTVFNLITGVYKHDAGSIRFDDKDLAPLKPAQIAGVGIGRTFQNIRLFAQLTVIENLLVACELQKKAGLFSAILRLPVHYEDEDAMHERAIELLRVFDLHEMADEAPTSLSYGNQRRLEIARAMMLKPRLLLLDEPAAGMNYGEAEGLKTQIRWLRDTFKLGVVLVEHNMQVVMGVCEEIHVLDHGETIAHGNPLEIRKHPKVLAAYLGEDEEAPSVRAAVAEVSERDVASLAPPSSSQQIPAAARAAPSSSQQIPAARSASSSQQIPAAPSLSAPPSSRPVVAAQAPAPAPAPSSQRAVASAPVDAPSDPFPARRPPSQPDAGRVGPATPAMLAAAKAARPSPSQPDLGSALPPKRVPSSPGLSPGSSPLGVAEPVSNRLSDAAMDDISKGLFAELERGISILKEAAEKSAAAAPPPEPTPPPASAPASAPKSAPTSGVPTVPPGSAPRSAPTSSSSSPSVPSSGPGRGESKPAFTMNEAPTGPKMNRLTTRDTLPGVQQEDELTRKVALESLGDDDDDDDDDEPTRAISPERALEALELHGEVTKAISPEASKQAAEMFEPPTREAFPVVKPPLPAPRPPPVPAARPPVPKKPDALPERLSNVDRGWSDRKIPAAPPAVIPPPSSRKPKK